MNINIDILICFHESWMILVASTMASFFQDASNVFCQTSRRSHFYVSHGLIKDSS